MSAGIITVNPDTAESYSVQLRKASPLSIGRRPDTAGRQKLVLAVPEVSAQHAEIRYTPDGWTIRDSGSTNGTLLNGERLTAGREYTLHNGDRIKIAQIELLVNFSSEPAHRPLEQEEEIQERTYPRIRLINATILVGDIKGFTSLMEKHAKNPELVMQAAQQIFASLNEEINSNHGQLEKIVGDAIMSYWQAEESKPDQRLYAYQACYTALRLRSLVTVLAQNTNFWPFPDHPLKIDLALATGPVAAGALGCKEASPALLGDTANLAFRLEKLIGEDASGEIVVDDTTYNLTKDCFRFAELGKFNIKGRKGTVDVHRLLDLEGLPQRE